MASSMQYGTFGVQRALQACGRAQEQLCEYKFSDVHSHIIHDKHTKTECNRVIGVPSATCYMLTYDHLLNNVLPPLIPYPALVPLTAGMVARATVTSLVSPLELIRTNLQATPPSPDNPHTLRSVLTSIRRLTQDQGLRYLWRGLGPTLWRDVP